MARLASNESPFVPLPSVLDALAHSGSQLHRYPDATGAPLREALGAHLGVAAGRVVVGPGSVALCRLLIDAVAGPGDDVVYAWRSFEAYPLLVALSGATAVPVPLREHRHDLAAMARVVGDSTRLVFVCSPNNPTGTVIGAGELTSFLDALPGDCLVVLDEAYLEYAPGVELGGAVLDRPNVVVLRTFSKAYGLAGLRLGYAVADARLAEVLRGAQVPFAVSQPAVVAGIASLAAAAQAELAWRVAGVVTRRDVLARVLAALGVTVPASGGNFLWLPLGERTAAVAAALEELGVFSRPFTNQPGGAGIRLTVGDEADMELAAEALGDVLGRS